MLTVARRGLRLRRHHLANPRLGAHGYAKEKSQGIRGYSGIDLKPDERRRADLD
jgi:hypothetical protein